MAWDIVVKTKVYHLLANELFFRIYNGTYALGSKLPSCLELSKEAGSSPETLRKAIRDLQECGVIEKTRYGYFVTSDQEKVFEYRDNYLAVVEHEYLAAKQKVNAVMFDD